MDNGEFHPVIIIDKNIEPEINTSISDSYLHSNCNGLFTLPLVKSTNGRLTHIKSNHLKPFPITFLNIKKVVLPDTYI